MCDSKDVVWIMDENVWGSIIGGMGAFYSTVQYTKGGMDFEVLLENDEFRLMEDLIEYDDDDD